MILKKPYVFFIKAFKPIHLLLSILVLYLISLSNDILKFLSDYMYSAESAVGEEIINSLFNDAFYVVPIIIIILFLTLLSIMYKKNKPVTFYFMGIFSFIVILVINIYTVNFLNVLVENIVSVKAIKLIHDLVLINIILESICLALLLIRGTGIDFKKFDFNSDMLKFEINESDKEEFEVSVNIDFNEKRRKRKEKYRNIKYIYIENKFIINIFIIILLLISTFIIIYFINKSNKINKEGIYYAADSFVFKVNNSTILNTDFRGNKITDNYLLIVDTNIKPNYANESLYLNDFSLKIENIVFKPVKKYFDELIDLGNFYQEEVLNFQYSDYIFVYEIPQKYIYSKMIFSYTSKGKSFDVVLDPKVFSVEESVLKIKKITELLNFDEPLNGVEFKINDYKIQKEFLINYKYCIKENDCISSKEYLKPSINENYDKVILKLDVEYKEESDLNVDSFYKLLSNFGSISYQVNGNWISTYKIEGIVSKKVSLKGQVYIGVDSNIVNADSIKFVFDIRGQKYEYILK